MYPARTFDSVSLLLWTERLVPALLRGRHGCFVLRMWRIVATYSRRGGRAAELMDRLGLEVRVRPTEKLPLESFYD